MPLPLIAFFLGGLLSSQGGTEDSIVLPLDKKLSSDIRVVYGIGINGLGPYPCLFDTGASLIFLANSFAKDLKIKPIKTSSINANGTREVQGSFITLKSIALSGIPFTNVPAATVELPSFLPVTIRVLAGAPLLGVGAVRMDFDKQAITLFHAESFKYLGSGIGIPLMRDSRGIPTLDATIDGVTGRFTLDTGDVETISLNAEFIAKHNLTAKYKNGIAGHTTDVSGTSPAKTVRASSLKIGTYSLNSPFVTVITDKRGDRAEVDGIIGIRVLNRFNFVLDATHGKAYFEPRTTFSNPFIFSRSGILEIHASGKSLIVSSLASGGAAEAAGVQTGDQLLAINGVPMDPKNPSQMTTLNEGPLGSKVKLSLRRGLENMDVELVLRDAL